MMPLKSILDLFWCPRSLLIVKRTAYRKHVEWGIQSLFPYTYMHRN